MSDDAPAAVEQDVLDDLTQRLRATRRVRLPRGLGWDRGTDGDYLAELIGYWTGDYDWRAAEQRVRDLPWQFVDAGGAGLRVIHQRASDPSAPVAVLLHGWPDSVLRFAKVLPLLTDIHVVVPALPGFPFADPLHEPGMSTSAMSRVVGSAMSELGYDRYVASGGDIGSGVAEGLAAQRSENVAALHLTDVPFGHMLSSRIENLTEVEQAYRSAGETWQRREGAYNHEQSTKPHTVAVGLNDSPAGLAAWIVEKLRSWSDCAGDVESMFPRDDLLTWVTAYWVTGTIGTSFSPYVERRDRVDGVSAPTVVQQFPHDLVHAPREFAERFFDVREWLDESTGGHFAAWERPEAFVQGLRSALALG